MTDTTVQLRSLITPEGELRLTLEDAALGAPGPDEVVVQVEAAPINPSDLGELLGPADLSTLSVDPSAARPVTTAQVPAKVSSLAAARMGRSLALGLEGAGTVVDAGENAKHLIGKVVGAGSGRMYARCRRRPAADVLPFPDGVSPKQGAAAFVNPPTALGMLCTMRLDVSRSDGPEDRCLFLTSRGSGQRRPMPYARASPARSPRPSRAATSREISLAKALDPDIIRGYQRKATGEKYLIVLTED